MQSLDRMRAEGEDLQQNLEQISQALDNSPRKYGHIRHNVDLSSTYRDPPVAATPSKYGY